MPLPGALYREPLVDHQTGLITKPWLLYLNNLMVGTTPAGGVAPADAQYIVAALNGILTAERLATTTSSMAWDCWTAGQAKAALTTTVVTAGTYGDASHVGQFTVDVHGRLSFAANVAITAGTQAWVPMTTGAIPGEIMFV